MLEAARRLGVLSSASCGFQGGDDCCRGIARRRVCPCRRRQALRTQQVCPKSSTDQVVADLSEMRLEIAHLP